MRKLFFGTIILLLMTSMISTPVSAKQLGEKLSHGAPNAVGMDKKTLNEIDQIVEEAIN